MNIESILDNSIVEKAHSKSVEIMEMREYLQVSNQISFVNEKLYRRIG
ncbi:MAG TPA: hypothetical protein PKZ69_04790 [Candidatus Cloacimonadota bacterium]|nr:hypothetical protein [Candidatus Cloacimonadota bacterium]HOQ80608.1 hypothetical protein [Candidatus Cloacimonadota bacterium]HPK40919.1 hypothetical protein [Candidatus Cloacimonadota bacterium]